jgi:hypothetical protein
MYFSEAQNICCLITATVVLTFRNCTEPFFSDITTYPDIERLLNSFSIVVNVPGLRSVAVSFGRP